MPANLTSQRVQLLRLDWHYWNEPLRTLAGMCSSMRNYNDENNDSDDYYAVVDCRQRLAAIKMAGCATAVVSSFVRSFVFAAVPL